MACFLVIILKQIPHAIGYDVDYEGDMDFIQKDGFTSFTEIEHMLNFFSPSILLISITSFLIILLWENKKFKQLKFSKFIPASLLVVFSGIGLNAVFIYFYPDLVVSSNHLVSIPVGTQGQYFTSILSQP